MPDETTSSTPSLVELREAAQSLSIRHEYAAAIDAWHRVEEQLPGDEQAARMIASLVVRISRQRGGLETPVTASFPARPVTPSPLPDQSQAFTAQYAYDEARRQFPDVQRTPIQQLELAVREFPSRADLYLQLAPLYLEKNRIYDAERLLTKGVPTTGSDPRVRRLWEEVTLLRFDHEITDARKVVKREDSPASHHALADLLTRKARAWGEILLSRTEREPEEATHHYALGMLRKEASQWQEAVVSLSRAVHDPQFAAQAALAMAHCLRQLGEVPEAMQQLRVAAQAATQHGPPEVKREALNKLADWAIALKLLPLAERYLRELLAVDPRHAESQALLARITAISSHEG